MQRNIANDARIALILERIVWHAAAGAALAVMILVLLGSLRWLDEIAPRSDRGADGVPKRAVAAGPPARPEPGGTAAAP